MGVVLVIFGAGFGFSGVGGVLLIGWGVFWQAGAELKLFFPVEFLFLIFSWPSWNMGAIFVIFGAGGATSVFWTLCVFP